jgi:hypothetical protein
MWQLPSTWVAKLQRHHSAGEVMTHIFFEWQGVMNSKFVPECASINKVRWMDVLIIYEWYLQKPTSCCSCRNSWSGIRQVSWYYGPRMGLLFQPLMTDEYGALAEWQLAGENQNAQRNLPLCHSVHQTHMNNTGIEPRPLKWEASNYQLGYEMAYATITHQTWYYEASSPNIFSWEMNRCHFKDTAQIQVASKTVLQ